MKKIRILHVEAELKKIYSIVSKNYLFPWGSYQSCYSQSINIVYVQIFKEDHKEIRDVLWFKGVTDFNDHFYYDK